MLWDCPQSWSPAPYGQRDGPESWSADWMPHLWAMWTRCQPHPCCPAPVVRHHLLMALWHEDQFAYYIYYIGLYNTLYNPLYYIGLSAKIYISSCWLEQKGNGLCSWLRDQLCLPLGERSQRVGNLVISTWSPLG